mgnify:CR=1 FL=1
MCAHGDTSAKLSQFKVSAEQWEDAQRLCSWLEKPSMITTQMGGEKYVTISKALLAKMVLLKHCNDHIEDTNDLVRKANLLHSSHHHRLVNFFHLMRLV